MAGETAPAIASFRGKNLRILRPNAQLVAKGPSFGLRPPVKFPMRVPSPQGTVISSIQPVFVHTTIDKDGHAIEAEALRNSNPELTSRALDLVKNSNQGEAEAQREAFIDVEFLQGNRNPQIAAMH
jgi:hypothetical protein